MKKIQKYHQLYAEDITMGNFTTDEDIPTEEEYIDMYVDETAYMDDYFSSKYE